MKHSRVAAAHQNAARSGEQFRQHSTAEQIAAINAWTKHPADCGLTFIGRTKPRPSAKRS